jgi:transketolase
MGWERYVGPQGVVIGIQKFGTSAPGSAVMEKFGLTAEHIVQKARALMNA